MQHSRKRTIVFSLFIKCISQKNTIDNKTEEKVGPHTICKTVMARGLVSIWKQTVFYHFDQPMTIDIIMDIVSALHEAGYTVVGIVGDLRATNTGLWSKLGVKYDGNNIFPHLHNPDLKVFIYADVPHLLKLMRNHLLDHGFTVENYKIDIHHFFRSS